MNLSSVDPALASLIETSRVAVITAPKSAAAWGRLGEALHAGEFQAEAICCYSNAAVLDPRDARWPYLQGLLDLQEHPDAALQHLSRATDLAGQQTDAPRFALARALIERGQYESARNHLRLLVASNPNHAAAHLELARIDAFENHFKEATKELQWALTNQFTARQALLLGSQIAQRNNQPEVADQISRRLTAIPRGFDWPDPYLKEVQSLRADRVRLADQANGLLQQQHLPEAEAALTRLLAAFPNDAEGLLLLGRLKYLQKDCAGAEAAYRRHLAQQPNSLNGLVQLGIALLCQQQWTNAAGVLEQAVALKPDFAAAHHNLGVARSHAGDSAGAIRALRDALRCAPGDVNTLFALAEELANTGDVKEAVECVKRAEAIAPNDPRVRKAREQLDIK